MSDSGFKKQRKKDTEAMEQFVEGADMQSNVSDSSDSTSSEEEEVQQPFYTTLQPRFKEMIQAVAYYERISQREVVERALESYYQDNQQQLQNALDVYRKQAE